MKTKKLFTVSFPKNRSLVSWSNMSITATGQFGIKCVNFNNSCAPKQLLLHFTHDLNIIESHLFLEVHHIVHQRMKVNIQQQTSEVFTTYSLTYNAAFVSKEIRTNHMEVCRAPLISFKFKWKQNVISNSFSKASVKLKYSLYLHWSSSQRTRRTPMGLKICRSTLENRSAGIEPQL